MRMHAIEIEQTCSRNEVESTQCHINSLSLLSLGTETHNVSKFSKHCNNHQRL